MKKFQLEDLEVTIAPTGASDAVGGIPCGGVAVVMIIILL
jgi:hypothetical protein